MFQSTLFLFIRGCINQRHPASEHVSNRTQKELPQKLDGPTLENKKLCVCVLIPATAFSQRDITLSGSIALHAALRRGLVGLVGRDAFFSVRFRLFAPQSRSKTNENQIKIHSVNPMGKSLGQIMFGIVWDFGGPISWMMFHTKHQLGR